MLDIYKGELNEGAGVGTKDVKDSEAGSLKRLMTYWNGSALMWSALQK